MNFDDHSYKTGPAKSLELYKIKEFIIMNKMVSNLCTNPKNCKLQTLP